VSSWRSEGNSEEPMHLKSAVLLPSLIVLSVITVGCGGGTQISPPSAQTATPAFWPVAGTYSPTQITISDSVANSTIYYTVDGSTPSASSLKYTGPITISATTTVKAIATAGGYSPSAIATANYIVPVQNGKGPAVSVALTTDDQSRKMEAQAATVFTTSNASGNVIYVDETETYQPVEGFGAAFTDSAAFLLNEVAQPSALGPTMSDLFSRNGNGIGLSFMRTPMAASDLARSQYSYDDNGGTGDPTLANFSVAHDQADIIPIILQARQLNPQMKLMANPWSPPACMKTNGSMVGGFLQPSMYAPFAQYFVKYLQAYSAAGINVDYVSIQNEPSVVTRDYPGMCLAPTPGTVCSNRNFSPTDETTAIRDYVLPAFAAAHLNARLLVMDDSWGQFAYATSVMSDPTIGASSQVAGVAWHGYGGPTPAVMLAMNNIFRSKGNYETEHSGFANNSDQVKMDFEEITLIMRNWGRSYVKWSLALDENHGPHTGGCTNCTPIVTVNSSSGAITYGIEYYTLGHFSKYILPGAIRVYSSNSTGIVSAAFLNSDGSKTLVAYNDSTTAQSFQVQWGDQSFGYTLPSLAGATFTWTGAQTGSYAVSATDPIQASSFDSSGGKKVAGNNSTFGLQAEYTSDTNGGYDVGFSSDGDYAVYRHVDFGAAVSGVSARLACNGNCGGMIEFHLDSVAGTLIASVPIPATGGWQSWTTATAPASSAAGVHDVYVVFRAAAGGGTSDLGNLNWVQFN
jgi:glucosylceramidase